MKTKFKFIKKVKNQKGFSLVELDGGCGDHWYLSSDRYT